MVLLRRQARERIRRTKLADEIDHLIKELDEMPNRKGREGPNLAFDSSVRVCRIRRGRRARSPRLAMRSTTR